MFIKDMTVTEFLSKIDNAKDNGYPYFSDDKTFENYIYLVYITPYVDHLVLHCKEGESSKDSYYNTAKLIKELKQEAGNKTIKIKWNNVESDMFEVEVEGNDILIYFNKSKVM